jgi:hypothetical protein
VKVAGGIKYENRSIQTRKGKNKANQNNKTKAISQNKMEPLRNHENKYKQNINHRLLKKYFFGKKQFTD